MRSLCGSTWEKILSCRGRPSRTVLQGAYAIIVTTITNKKLTSWRTRYTHRFFGTPSGSFNRSKKMEKWFLEKYIYPLKFLEMREDSELYKALCRWEW